MKNEGNSYMTPPAPTVADMIAWCEVGANTSDILAYQWREHDDGARWRQDAVMLRAIATRLRQTEESR